jgi:hypothetical protein
MAAQIKMGDIIETSRKNIAALSDGPPVVVEPAGRR